MSSDCGEKADSAIASRLLTVPLRSALIQTFLNSLLVLYYRAVWNTHYPC